ncbi:MAG TPA: beta/gamma crystallin-related protein [Luteimonas sp.]|nr:beta/gamma crystallin-related protein [Luteimonas sp.]
MSIRLLPALTLAAFALSIGGVVHAAPQNDRWNSNNDRDGRYDRDRGGRGDRNSGSITVYEHADFRGRSQSFDRGIRNLKSVGMNDMISSVQLRGTWEVCEHENYNGRCQTLGRDVRNFERSGLNDRISSLRPVEGRRRGR